MWYAISSSKLAVGEIIISQVYNTCRHFFYKWEINIWSICKKLRLFSILLFLFGYVRLFSISLFLFGYVNGCMVEYCAKNISYQILPSENLIFFKSNQVKKKNP